jgi:hypothetical protein
LADALLVEGFSAAAPALACLLIALNDVLDFFAGVFFVVRLAMLPRGFLLSQGDRGRS